MITLIVGFLLGLFVMCAIVGSIPKVIAFCIRLMGIMVFGAIAALFMWMVYAVS